MFLDIPLPKLKVQPMKYRFERIDGKVPIYVELPVKFRLKCFLLLLLTLLYLPITTLLLKAIKCSPKLQNNERSSNSVSSTVLDMEQTSECYQPMQFVFMVLIALWAVPFPIAVFFGSKLLYTCNVNPTEFFVILLCPPSSFVYYMRSRFFKQHRRTIKRHDAILAKHMLMTLYESYRLQKVDKRFDVMWDVALLAQKLVISVLVVFTPDDYRLFLVFGFLLFCALLQFIVRPFNRDLTNRLQMISLVALLVLTLVNVFWQEQSDCPFDGTALVAFQHIFLHLEYLVITAPVLVAIISVILAYLFACCCVTVCRHRNRKRMRSSSSRKQSSVPMVMDEKKEDENGEDEWKYPRDEDIADGDDDKEKEILMNTDESNHRASQLQTIDSGGDSDGDVGVLDEDYYRQSESDEDEDDRLVFTDRGQSMA